MDNLDGSKYGIPEPFPYHEARRLFNGAYRLACLGVGLLVGDQNFNDK